MRARSLAGWLALVALIELSARALVYALAPTPVERLDGQLGGPSLVLVALVAVGLASALSSGLVWLAAMGARERWALMPAGHREPRLAARRVLVRAVLLWAVGMLLFAALESYIHVRAGLGFHGLGCLLGPVHRNAIPVLGALSLIGAAAVSAATHLLTWMRRTLGRVFGARPQSRGTRRRVVAAARASRRARHFPSSARPRGPPVVAV